MQNCCRNCTGLSSPTIPLHRCRPQGADNPPNHVRIGQSEIVVRSQEIRFCTEAPWPTATRAPIVGSACATVLDHTLTSCEEDVNYQASTDSTWSDLVSHVSQSGLWLESAIPTGCSPISFSLHCGCGLSLVETNTNLISTVDCCGHQATETRAQRFRPISNSIVMA